LVPQSETGKINCVRLPHYGRLPPGGAWAQRRALPKVRMELLALLGVIFRAKERKAMSIGTIILIILIIALLGGFSGIGGGPFYGTGYYGGGGLGVVIVILLILVLMGRL
jgi:hypothetical protein